MTKRTEYDVVIMGGGLAGLTLALQIKLEREDTNILVLEKRSEPAPESAHKVGESTVELGTYYLRNVLQLADYLDAQQLPKYGLRFFFSPHKNQEIQSRVELGATSPPPVPSHQLDRGIFENYLMDVLTGKGVEIQLNASVDSCDLSEDGAHKVKFSVGEEQQELDARWAIDATGRRAILKHQLGFKEKLDHNTNAVWFRVRGEIDVDSWSDDAKWKELPGDFRRLATVHLMGEGYWVWLIPLVSGNTSVGIVSDANLHQFEDMNRLEGALKWLDENEPQCAWEMRKREDDILDFMALKHYAHHSSEIYGTNRWAVTGDAGAFLDPFYSPGTDFISMNNSWITDLVVRELDGEDVHVRSIVFNKIHRGTVDSWIPIYQNKYPMFGNSQVMVQKIFWDWATYWAIPTLLFTNKGYVNMDVLRPLFFNEDGDGQRFGRLNENVQQMFLDWHEIENPEISDKYFDPFDIPYLLDFHEDMVKSYDTEGLLKKVEGNLNKLEAIAVQLFKGIYKKIHGVDIDEGLDPYEMSLKKDVSTYKTSEATEVDSVIAEGVEKLWMV